MNKIIFPLLGLTAHGGNRVICQVANYFVKNCDVVISTAIISPEFSFLLSDDVELVYDKMPFKRKELKWICFLLAFPFIYRNEKDVKFFTTHFLTIIPGLFLKFALKKDVYFICQGLEHNAYKNKVLSFFSRSLSYLGHRYLETIVINKKLALDIEEEFGIRHKNIINLGIDDSFLERSIVSSLKKYDVVCFPRKEGYKGLEYLKELVEKLSNEYSVLCITQDCFLMDYFSLLPKVVVVNPANDKELINAIDDSRVCVYTSTYEGFGLPPLECMARGVPVVMFDCVGNRNYTNESNSIVLTEYSVDELFFQTETILNDEQLFSKLSVGARVTAQKFVFSEQLASFYNMIK